MPYELKKCDNGYKVVSKDTGKEHSKHALPKNRAIAQMKALYYSMGAEARRGK